MGNSAAGKTQLGLIVLLIGLLGAAAAAVAAGGAEAATTGARASCLQPDAHYEDYGPTDINAQAGDNLRRLTVNENEDGTLTGFKWPNPSFSNQVKYFAVSRDASGKVKSEYPNEGVFAGIRYRTAEGVGFAWLRDWRPLQRYDSHDTAVPVTTYRSPRSLGLRVTSFDLVDGDAFQRQFWVKRKPGSPVKSAQVVVFENFNPVASHTPLVPFDDWCWRDKSDMEAVYAPQRHAILNWWTGVDKATDQPSSVALAMGFDRPDAAHQVGADGFDPDGDPDGPTDPYLQLEAPGHRLGGATAAHGQTTGALAARLRFDRRGWASARFTAAAGTDASAAAATLKQARGTPFAAELRSDRKQWRRWLKRMKLPKSSDQRIMTVAKRSLISLRLAMVPGTGAIVASSATQGPYGMDWIRDGAFFNEFLDRNGYTDAVTRHNLFYARIQASPENPSDLRPFGNWAMASYGDGIDGAPIAWEIDETGLGIWTLYRHALFLDSGKDRNAYLEQAYPAIVRAADFLTTCRDPGNGLQCKAHEDDNYNLSQTLHGAETTVLGLRSAIKAAKLAGDDGPRVGAWRSRLAELRAAIDRELYDPATRTYRNSPDSDRAASFQNAGWLLYPVVIRPRSDPAMRATAIQVQRGVRKSLAGDRGSYELKGVLGLAHQWSDPTVRQKQAMVGDLAYIARGLTTRTGLFGEAWERFSEGWARPVQDMPHVWEHILFSMAADKVFGREHYEFQRRGYYERRCRSGKAPRAAC